MLVTYAGRDTPSKTSKAFKNSVLSVSSVALSIEPRLGTFYNGMFLTRPLRWSTRIRSYGHFSGSKIYLYTASAQSARRARVASSGFKEWTEKIRAKVLRSIRSSA